MESQEAQRDVTVLYVQSKGFWHFDRLTSFALICFFTEFIEMGFFPKWRILRIYFPKNRFVLILGLILSDRMKLL